MTIIDLFAGPGGWDVAALSLGVDPIGVEWDEAACSTRAVAGLTTIRGDVGQLAIDHLAIDGLIASPPCPTFSSAGKRDGAAEIDYLLAHVHACASEWSPYVAPEHLGYDEEFGEPIPPDPRSALVLEPLRWIHATTPSWVALEQVPEVLPVWEAYVHVLRSEGWSAWCGVLNSADFGVPQTRRRAILMASRTKVVQPPEPTHCRGGADGLFGRLEPWVSMAEALGWYGEDEPARTLAGHRAPRWMYPDPDRKHGRIVVGFPRKDDRGDSPDGYRERAWRDGDEPAFALTEKARSWVLRERQEHGAARTMDEPAMTITGSADNGNFAFVNTGRDWKPGGTAGSVPGTWWLERPATTVQGDPRLAPPGRGESQFGPDALRLTVPDALRLQSFPADYPVQGTKTKQFEQVGNAIPPLLARAILARLIDRTEAP